MITKQELVDEFGDEAYAAAVELTAASASVGDGAGAEHFAGIARDLLGEGRHKTPAGAPGVSVSKEIPNPQESSWAS